MARLRKESELTQAEVADYINGRSTGGRMCTFKNVSHWERSVSQPSIEQFLLLCELYGVHDIQETFRSVKPGFLPWSKLNSLGHSRVQEYVSMLSANPLFCEPDDETAPRRGAIKLYDIPAAAGVGVLLDSDYYEYLDVDDTVPMEADFAIKVSGDSMAPRFVDAQIAFVREQHILDIGDIGIFSLDGDAYIKKLGRGELISLNPLYKPIPIRGYNSLVIFGKVLG